MPSSRSQTWCRACATGLTPAPISFSLPTPWSICPISHPSWVRSSACWCGGLLAFTVETHDGDGIVLGEGLRYAHSAGYVRGSIGEAGLMLSRCEDLSARNEDNVPVPGLVVVAAKP